MDTKLNNYNNRNLLEKRKDIKKSEKSIEYKLLEIRKRNIQIEKKSLKDLKIDNIFVEKALKKNNNYRKLHGIPELISDDYLIKRAFILAKKKLTNFISEDLSYKDGSELGANIIKCENGLTPEKLMDKWYSENKKYNYIEPIELENNNFTQMIWKNSKRFGIGYYYQQEKEIENKQENKQYYYVALYYPAGNIPGEYKKNVFKRISGKNNNNIIHNENIKNKIDSHHIVLKDDEKYVVYKNKIIKIIKIVLLILVIINNIWKLYREKYQLDN